VSERRYLAVVLLVIGLVLLAVGIIYLTVEAKSLPSILGQVHGYAGHRSKRGTVAVIAGGVLTVVGGGLLIYKPGAKS
jgi:hypothetical protein